MKIINRTNNAVLAENAIVADTFFTRAKGLLDRKDFNQGEALVIRPCNSIHTFFMRFPIDLLFVTKDSLVIKAISRLKPYRISGIYFKSAFVIELPPGTLEANPVSQGDTLLIGTATIF